ncbi:MAG: molybdopterin synthase sulfur carrier subunit [Bacteroidetes bacterium SW_10_40_5]|nr:MAG: molybdopterin synthase sulfur carrier subunit [Bacteroidetes bacterium SW_10_40_5]
MATIQIPTPLRKYTNQQSKIEVQENNVEKAIQQLVSEYPEIKENLLDENGNIRSYINVFVGDNNIKSLDKEQTVIKEHDLVNIVPAIAGGSHYYQPCIEC